MNSSEESKEQWGTDSATCARAYVAGVHKHIDDHPDSSLEEVRICLFLGPLVDLVAKEMDRPKLPTV